ncbi:hypothetical protein LCGC14_2880470 [marine sediment metagenome]|uniref:Peptidase M15A C-terminal domain-containing protein n=1 Tax=marine sediment metagenome TaxID=412755 RepID=A0A0F8YLZ7_9ZZZZ
MFTKKTTRKSKSRVKPETKVKVDEPKIKKTVGIVGAIAMMTIWPNISVQEATCSCCGVMASAGLLDRIQALRDGCGFPIPFTSIYRCPDYNKKIGGSKLSLHLLSATREDNENHGAVDCGIDKSHSKNRWTILNVARQLGMNNFEVCDGHLHIGWAPHSHAMQNRLYWGVSK